MLIENFIIEVYCAVEEALKSMNLLQLRSRGFAPKLTDAEVLTMELAGSYLGYKNDKSIWSYFCRHWKEWFPELGCRTSFVRQASNLWKVKQILHQYWLKKLGALGQGIYLVDGFPIPVCHFRRAHFSSVFKGDASYGYCASKSMTYYGFKGLLLTTQQGIIADIVIVPAHVDERDALEDFELKGISGMMLGDKGFIRPELTQNLSNIGIDLQTPKRGNMRETRSKRFLSWIKSKRRLVETVIGQLTERFAIQANFARNLWHLTSRIYRKIASHTLCFLLNRHHERPLAIENLLEI